MIRDLGKLGKEMNASFGRFLNYSTDHLFDDYKEEVKKEMNHLYAEYDKAYTKFRAELEEEGDSNGFIKIIDSTHEFAGKRLVK